MALTGSEYEGPNTESNDEEGDTEVDCFTGDM